MAALYDLQWNSIMESSMFAEKATLTVKGIDIEVTGIYISGSFETDSPAPYSPKTYIEKDYFRMSRLQVEGKVEGSLRESLTGSTLTLSERGLKFRVYEVLGKNQGDIELTLQNIREEEDGTDQT